MSYGAAFIEGVGSNCDDCEVSGRVGDYAEQLDKYHQALLTVLHMERVSGPKQKNVAVIAYVEKFLSDGERLVGGK